MSLNPSALIMYAFIKCTQPLISNDSVLKNISFNKWNRHRTMFSDIVGYCIIIVLFQLYCILTMDYV